MKDVLFIRWKESTCAKQEPCFNKWRIDVAFSSGCTSRRTWRAIPRVGELPFLKGFSLWTDQSERVYFYWPPGPNPVVTISTRVGPGSRLTTNCACSEFEDLWQTHSTCEYNEKGQRKTIFKRTYSKSKYQACNKPKTAWPRKTIKTRTIKRVKITSTTQENKNVNHVRGS